MRTYFSALFHSLLLILTISSCIGGVFFMVDGVDIEVTLGITVGLSLLIGLNYYLWRRKKTSFLSGYNTILFIGIFTALISSLIGLGNEEIDTIIGAVIFLTICIFLSKHQYHFQTASFFTAFFCFSVTMLSILILCLAFASISGDVDSIIGFIVILIPVGFLARFAKKKHVIQKNITILHGRTYVPIEELKEILAIGKNPKKDIKKIKVLCMSRVNDIISRNHISTKDYLWLKDIQNAFKITENDYLKKKQLKKLNNIKATQLLKDNKLTYYSFKAENLKNLELENTLAIEKEEDLHKGETVYFKAKATYQAPLEKQKGWFKQTGIDELTKVSESKGTLTITSENIIFSDKYDKKTTISLKDVVAFKTIAKEGVKLKCKADDFAFKIQKTPSKIFTKTIFLLKNQVTA